MRQIKRRIFGALQILFGLFAVLLMWLYKNKMGVKRYVLNKNRIIKGLALPTWLPILAAVALCALAVFAAFKCRGNNIKKKPAQPKWALLCFLSLASGLFILLASPAQVPTYYFVAALMLASTLLQGAK